MSMMKRTLTAIALTSVMAAAPSAMAGDKESKHNGLTTYGDIAQYSIPAIGAGIALWKGDYEGFWQNAEGALWTAGLTHALKFAVDAERPNGGSHSWPSGHTSAAMQGAAFISMRYGWELGVPATIAAAAVGYSRVDGNYHYWRDVAAGTALAWGTQYLITEMGYSPTNLVISPFTNGKMFGIMGNFSF